MNDEEYEEAFKPDFEGNYDDRLKVFMNESEYISDSQYPLFFGTKVIGKDHSLWKHIGIIPHLIQQKKLTMTICFVNPINFPEYMKSAYIKIKDKHFPEGNRVLHTHPCPPNNQ